MHTAVALAEGLGARNFSGECVIAGAQLSSLTERAFDPCVFNFVMQGAASPAYEPRKRAQHQKSHDFVLRTRSSRVERASNPEDVEESLPAMAFVALGKTLWPLVRWQSNG
jgi:hypothetical protein